MTRRGEGLEPGSARCARHRLRSLSARLWACALLPFLLIGLPRAGLTPPAPGAALLHGLAVEAQEPVETQEPADPSPPASDPAGEEPGEPAPGETGPDEAGTREGSGEGEAGPPEGARAPDVQPPSAEPGVDPAPPASTALPAFVPGYRELGAATGLLSTLALTAPELAHTFELGRTSDQRAVTGIEFGAAGQPGLQDRPTVFLLGGLDGRSLAGTEAVLACVHRLLSDTSALPAGVTFVAVPWVAAEGLSWTRDPGLERPALDGRNAHAVDDDRDGLVDEDGPDDLDGDGMILDMLIEDPSGPWARGGDGRFLVPAAPGEGVRFVWTREGRDDDGDGRFNEDPVGGVVLDRNFPVNRRGAWDDPRVGETPLSEPLARAVAELVLGRRAAVVVLFQGHHGSLAIPGGLSPDEGGQVDASADTPLFERVTEAFLAATGRTQAGVLTLREARGEPTSGAALDWLHAVPGALAIEVAPWGPRVEEPGEVTLRDARFEREGGPARGAQEAGIGPPRSLEDRALLGRTESDWARWLDNTRGGLGFVDWQPVELDGGRKGWVGGWEPRTILNPPDDSLERALQGLPEFALELAGSLPRIAVELTHAERDGELLRLRARVHNKGRLPTGLAREGSGVRLELGLPPGARLVAGSTSVLLPRLFGGELSREEAWVLVMPADATLTLTARADWAASAVREVRR